MVKNKSVSNLRLTRSDLINAVIQESAARIYLEIGIKKCENFSSIIATKKIGVDPRIGRHLNGLARFKRYLFKCLAIPIYYRDHHQVLYAMTSDHYFSSRFVEKVDVAFIDGLHHYDQVLRDFTNTCDWLNLGGVVVLHDCLPVDAVSAYRNQTTKSWNGDVWKAIYWLVQQSVDVQIFDFDQGCGVVKGLTRPLTFPSAPELLDLDRLTFDDFKKFRRTLNLVSESDTKMLIESRSLLT